jgi:5-methylcytosine-specific restriction endonuclease McrA
MSKSFAKAFYNSKAWLNVRREVLRRDRYTCAYCYGRAREVHHIVELTSENINNINISLNPDNLISLCHTCHEAITLKQGDIDDKYIFDDNGNAIPISPPLKN